MFMGLENSLNTIIQTIFRKLYQIRKHHIATQTRLLANSGDGQGRFIYQKNCQTIWQPKCRTELFQKFSPKKPWKRFPHHERQKSFAKAKRVQVDEIWSFTAAKQKNVAAMKNPFDGAGDTWTWTA